MAELPREYVLRSVTVDDIQAIVDQRVSMFRDMGVPVDERRLREASADWLRAMIPAGVYHGWVIDTVEGEVVSGAGITVLPWPPGPVDFKGRVPMVYNVFTDSRHRRRGLARYLMQVAHSWCRDLGFGVIALAASADGRHLYESLGYEVSRQPFMFKVLERPAGGT